MSKDILIALGAGILSAFASLAFLFGLPGALLAVYLAPLPLLLVGMDYGVKSGGIAGTTGIIVAGLLGGPLSALMFALIHTGPSWLIVRQALLKRMAADGVTEEWYPSGYILCLLSALASTALIIAVILELGAEGGLRGSVESYLDQITGFLLPNVEASDRMKLVNAMAPLFPGYLGTSWVIMAAVNASIAVAILIRAARIERPKTKLSELILPDWMSWALVGVVSIALLSGGDLEYASRNIALVLSVPFFFLGLAVVHELARQVSFPGLLLSAFYLILILSGWIGLVVIGAGLLEQWVGLRRHFVTRNDDPDENDH